MANRIHYVCLCFMLSVTMQAKQISLSSPDRGYTFTMNDDGGRLSYSVSWQGKTMILSSRLGIKAYTNWYEKLSIDTAEQAEYDETWHPVYGERSTVRDHYRSLKIEISQAGCCDRLYLEVRAYDEGIAWRYGFEGSQYLAISDEYTDFTMPEGTKAYFTPRAQTSYSLLPLKDWPGETERPLLLLLPDDKYVCLGEAEVVHYARTKFKLDASHPNTIKTAMSGPVEALAPLSSPWRYVMCGQKAGDILNHNDLLLNLNPPCKISDTSWILPGKVMREVTLTTEGAKSVVDFAAKHHLQYILFDAGWYGPENNPSSDATIVRLDPKRNPNPNALNLPAVIDYANQHKIGVILYVNHNALEQQLDSLLPLYERWGVKGVKFGFVNVGSQGWTSWMHEAVKKCARYHLMVDIHDEYRPTGFSRTYPNLMTQEGIRGNEEFPDATHNVTLPFTRFVAGAADYTICYYCRDFKLLEGRKDEGGVPRSRSLHTTPAHQLSMAVVFYSPLQHMFWYDKPSDAHDEPELQFFSDVPTTWDDSRVLDGAPGQYVSIARRKGDTWFAGNMTNNDARDLKLSLDFLDNGKSYRAEIYTDGETSLPTRTKVKVSTFRVRKGMLLRFHLKASGGAALRFVPETNQDKGLKNYKGQWL